MNELIFVEKCKNEIADYVSKELGADCTFGDVYCVWLCKTLQNNKGMFSTDVVHVLYFEVTYNGDKQEMYFDVYKKERNYLMEV